MGKKTKKRKSKHKPYSQRSDIEKIESNWRKIKGFMERKEWSSAIVRAATATEIAANLVIREELIHARKLDQKFVESLMRWANGIQGKFDKLIVPITEGKKYNIKFKKLKTRIEDINRQRNSIVHSGNFKNKKTAKVVIKEAEAIIKTFVRVYHKNFYL